GDEPAKHPDPVLDPLVARHDGATLPLRDVPEAELRVLPTGGNRVAVEHLVEDVHQPDLAALLDHLLDRGVEHLLVAGLVALPARGESKHGLGSVDLLEHRSTASACSEGPEVIRLGDVAVKERLNV